MTYICRYGHKDPKDGRKKMVHPTQQDCSEWVLHNPPKTSTAQAPVDSTPPKTEEQKAAVAPKSQGSGFLNIFRSEASTVKSEQVPTAEKGLQLLSGEDTCAFWQIPFTILEMGLNALLKFLKVKPLPPDLCNVKEGAHAFLISRNMRHITTQFFIYLKVETNEEAHILIAEGESAVTFAGVFIGIAAHLAEELPKSPVIIEWWDNMQKGVAPGESVWDKWNPFKSKQPDKPKIPPKDAQFERVPQTPAAVTA